MSSDIETTMENRRNTDESLQFDTIAQAIVQELTARAVKPPAEITYETFSRALDVRTLHSRVHYSVWLFLLEVPGGMDVTVRDARQLTLKATTLTATNAYFMFRDGGGELFDVHHELVQELNRIQCRENSVQAQNG